MDYGDFRAALGKVLRANRIKRGWSQEGLAYAARLSPSYLGGVERGKRNASITSLLQVAGALQVPLSRLVAEAEELAESERG